MFLFELSAGEINPQGEIDLTNTTMDDLAVRSFQDSIKRWSAEPGRARVPERAASRFAKAPGLLQEIR